MRFIRGFGRFWWDFVVGDEWRIAAGVVAVLAAGAVAVAAEWFTGSAIVVAVALGIAAVAILSIVLPARRTIGRSPAGAGGE